MALANQKTRCVIFRLTEQEYDSLRLASEKAGARSLSDYTRTGVLELTKDSALGGQVQQGFSEVNERLGEIQDLLDALSEQLAKSADTTEL